MTKRESKAFIKAEAKALKKAFPRGLSKRILPVSRPVSASTKTYVKRIVSANMETKYVQQNIFNQGSTLGYGLNNNGANNLGLSSTVNIIPTLAQGDDAASRDGNKIKTKGLYLKYSLRAQPVTSGGLNENPFIPFLVRVIVWYRKINRTLNDNSGILQGSPTGGNFGSAPETWLEPYNKDAFTIVYSKEFKMVAPRRATGQTAPNQWAQDAVLEGHKAFIMKKAKLSIPSTLIYDDSNNSNKPTNACYYLSVCVCNADGTTGLNPTMDQRLMVNADTQLYYTDA